jgi:putative transposase
VAGRTRAVAEDTPAMTASPPDEPPELIDEADAGHEPGPMAKVIPLGIFDPFEEAKKRW